MRAYIIAETAFHHQGDIQYLYRMIDQIAELKLNAVKFHLLLNLESYMAKQHPLFKQMKKWLFSEKQWNEIIDYSKKRKLGIVALCNDLESLTFINKKHKDLFAMELHATGLNDYFLLQEAAKFKNKVILGIGGSTMDEIKYAVEFLRSKNKEDIILMYGFQNYPTQYRDINLSKMLKIKNLFNLPVGYADHTAFDDPNNEIISVIPAMMGFHILEKHYTPDWGVKRVDCQAAADKKQMVRIKELMKLALIVYGDPDHPTSKAEVKCGQTGSMKKAIVAKKLIKKGEKLSLANLAFKRTREKSPLKQNQFLALIGRKAKKEIKKDEIITFSQIE